jgi:nicotinamidase-related amidase
MKKLFILLICVFTIQAIHAKNNEKAKEVKPVLIVMDVQNKYIPWMDQEETELAFEYINAYIELFRKHNQPIIRVYHQDKKRGPHQDSLDFQFPESILITDDDPMIIKNHPSAFAQTELKKTIDELGGNTVFICGLSAKGCVLATFFDTWNYDYDSFLIKNGLMSDNAKHTDQLEEIFGAVNYGIVRVLLEGIQ